MWKKACDYVRNMIFRIRNFICLQSIKRAMRFSICRWTFIFLLMNTNLPFHSVLSRGVDLSDIFSTLCSNYGFWVNQCQSCCVWKERASGSNCDMWTGWVYFGTYRPTWNFWYPSQMIITVAHGVFLLHVNIDFFLIYFLIRWLFILWCLFLFSSVTVFS